MHVLYVKPYSGEEAMVAKALPDHEVIVTDTLEAVDPGVASRIDVISVFVDTALDSEVLARFPKVRWICTRSTGYDHIDLVVARERGIGVAHVPRYGSQTVAEYAFALLLALSRNTFAAYSDMQKRSVVRSLEPYEGFDLYGKTLGVIGTGAIGKKVCEIAKGFRMRVLAFDQYPDPALLASDDVTYCELPLLLQESDVVTLHVPLLPETEHLIDAPKLALMKKTAYLINTARGEIVDTRALAQALHEGRIAGAGLDVLEGERHLKDEIELLGSGREDLTLWQQLVASHALVEMPNVIVTPHIAFNTREAKREITEVTIENLRGFAKGEVRNSVLI